MFGEVEHRVGQKGIESERLRYDERKSRVQDLCGGDMLWKIHFHELPRNQEVWRNNDPIASRRHATIHSLLECRLAVVHESDFYGAIFAPGEQGPGVTTERFPRATEEGAVREENERIHGDLPDASLPDQ